MKCNWEQLAACVFSLAVASARSSRRQGRIIGGEGDLNREFPFAVVLQMAAEPMLRICSGSLISSTFVLTAGHCCKPTPMLVKYTDMTLPPNQTKAYARIIKLFPHPGFTDIGASRGVRLQNRNDIGLIEISKVPSASIAKLSALDYRSLMGREVKCAGFGLTQSVMVKAPSDSDEVMPLQTLRALVIPCGQDGGISAFSPAVCVAARCGAAARAYAGDSGGPLALAGRLVGVCSGSAVGLVPLVGYTPVSPYLGWIGDVVRSRPVSWNGVAQFRYALPSTLFPYDR